MIPKFGKQFLIYKDPKLPSEFSHWKPFELQNGYILATHPDLFVTQASSNSTDITLLGEIYDPRIQEATNQQILDRLSQEADNFFELETKLASLGGRWVIIATTQGKTRIYHDAGGLKTVFYVETDQKLVIGSQPALLEAIGVTQLDSEKIDIFKDYKNPPAYWPMNTIPYIGVQQLLPNHTLDVQDGAITRYWPSKRLPQLSLNEAAEKMAYLLTGMISAMAHRRECVLSLSGGYDSRLLLACSKPARNKMRFITNTAPERPNYDLSIPKKMTKICGLNLEVFKIETDKKFVQDISQNVGNMYSDLSLTGVKTSCIAVGNSLNLQGTVISGTKCHYYKNGVHPTKISAKELSKITNFGENQIVIEGLSRWLNNAPDEFNVKILDLAFWEQYVGICTASGATLREGLIDLIPPMNCREFLETGLSTNVNYRIKPYPLIRQMIQITDPKLLEIPFNHDWVTDWQNSFISKMPLPWRIKKLLHLV